MMVCDSNRCLLLQIIAEVKTGSGAGDAAMIAGFILWMILAGLGFYKKLREDKKVITAIFLTALPAVLALLMKIDGPPFIGFARRSDFLFMPFVYIITYGLLRKIYKRMYDREPTYNRSSIFDPEDNRRQNVVDMIVFIFPMVFSVAFVMLLNSFWK